MERLISNAVTHKGERYDVWHSVATDFDAIPEDRVVKAHAVCLWKGKLGMVFHSKWKVWGLPGGGREAGENVLECLAREVEEELNCAIVESRPLAYQRAVRMRDGGDEHFRLYYLCEVVPKGEFLEDPAGTIAKTVWIEPLKYGRYIEDKEVRKAVMEDAMAKLELH